MRKTEGNEKEVSLLLPKATLYLNISSLQLPSPVIMSAQFGRYIPLPFKNGAKWSAALCNYLYTLLTP